MTRAIALCLIFSTVLAPPPDGDCTSLDAMVDGDCQPSTDAAPVVHDEQDEQPTAEPGAETQVPAADAEAPEAQLEQPDPLQLYESGMSAWQRRDCNQAREDLDQFTRLADAQTYPNKLVKAGQVLTEMERSGCTPGADEYNEAASAGATKLPDRSDGLIAGGAVMVGLGAIALISGIVLMAQANVEYTDPDLMCTLGKPCGLSCIPLDQECGSDTPVRGGFLAGGLSLIAIATGLGIGGGVMILRGSRPARLTVTPTGVVLRF
jgi:hypothetical protein